jgi:uncharacterized protein YjbI with pentapeptide repeats
MSKISELGPILGVNTRPEDLFVIVNLIQGDDGTKNITRRELVQAIQYEEFNRITITGGSISGVNMFNSTLSGVTINDSIYNRGTINDTTINRAEIDDSTMTESVINESSFNDGTVNNSIITNSEFNDGTLERGTGNNMVFINSTIDNSDFSNGTGNNNVFTNTRIEDIEIEGGTANNLILTNLVLDDVVMTDVEISRGTIDTVDISNSNIFDTDLDDVDITNSRFSNGEIWDTRLANNTITGSAISTSTFNAGAISNSTANNIVITQSVFDEGTITDTNIDNSDFSNGTGNNNVFTNTTIDEGTVANTVITDSSFQGNMNNVIAQNMTITSSSTEDMTSANTNMTRSSFDGGVITNSDIRDGTIERVDLANSVIVDSTLVDYDMQLSAVFDPGIAENSFFALKNEKTGKVEQISYAQLTDELGRSAEKALKVHVAVDGDDNNPGSMLKPVRTLKRASQLAIEKAGGDVNRNDINNAVHISCGPGTYYVDEPIVLPDDCAMTSTAGQYATVIQKKPGWERTNGVLVGSGCYVQGFAYMNFEVDNFDQPEGGFAIAYRPGALLRRSPYIRDSSQLSNFNRLDVEPPLNPFNSKGTILDLGQEFYLEVGHSPQAQFEIDDEVTFSSGATGYISYVDDIDSDRQIYVRNLKGNVEVGDILYAQRGGTGTVERIGIDDFPNRLVGRGGGCLLADRAVLDTDSLYTYVLCFGFTPRTQNGTGYVAKNGAGVNGIGSLSIFTRQAFFALDGGQMTLNNSGSQFGDISMRARGNTVIVNPAKVNDSNNLIANTAFADDLAESAPAIIDDMIEYLTANTTTGFNGSPGLGYQGYNADKCFRDTGIIVDNVGMDVATNSNYWGRLNGITYRSPISYVVVNEQLTETVGSIEHLKDEMNFIFENANTAVNDRVDKSINETLNVLQNGEPVANSIIFADTGVGPRTGAREVVQDNREFIIEEFVDWLDNNPNFFAYDSAKCKRDVREFILPAVKYDTMLDTNYNSVTAGNAYYFKAAKNVIGAQRDETISAYERLRYSTDKIVEANSAPFAAEAYEKFEEILSILKQDGTRYTPTAATYATDGTFTITIGSHNLEVGRYILLMPESFTFTCDTDGGVVELVHPRKSDPAFKSALPITATTGTTITVNVGATGYKGTHTLKDVLDGAVIELGSEISFSDDTNIPANKRNARKQLQANKAFIQDYMMNWADDEWFFYDSAKCQRDMKEYIVPAVLRDAQLGTNFNSIQSGVAYRGATAAVTINDQLPETVGAIEHLKLETVDLLADSIYSDRVETAYNDILNIMAPGGRQYTPTDVDYNPSTGVMVISLNNHTFEVGDQIIFDEEAITLSCANTATGIVTEISHPRTTDPLFRTAVSITAANTTTITVNAGSIPNGYAEPHTFVRAKLNGIKEYGINNGRFTPTAADYSGNTGLMTMTIGAHDLRIGDTIQIEAGSMTFECSNTSGTFEISHPRATDPAFETDLVITAVTATTITVNAGDSGTYTSPQFFVYAEPDAVKVTNVYNGKFTPSTASYDPISGDMTLTIGQHNLPVGRWINIADSAITFSCANTSNASIITELSHPRVGEPAYRQPVRITGATGTTITVNVGNANGYQSDHTFVSADVDCIDTNAIYFNDPAKVDSYFTPSTATYAPDTGVMEITLGEGHGVTTDDHIEFKPQSVVFSCANGATVTEISHPRIGEPNYQKPIAVTAVSNTTITVNTGAVPNGYANNHTFVSAEEGAVIKVRSTITRDKINAADTLLKNKAFLQDEIDAWLKDNYFVYDDKRCMRDTGYILDAVRRDMATDSNINSIFAGYAYRSGNASTDKVITEQLTETAGAIRWLRDQVSADILSGDGEARANTAFDEIVQIMENGTSNADIITFGDGYHSEDTLAARKALQANKAMLQDEVTSWMANTYPGFVYNEADCERDLGYFIDAVSWDVQHGSNAATLGNARVYFDNAVSVLDDEEKPKTAHAYQHIAELAGQIVREEIATLQTPVAQTFNASNNELTPTDASYDPVTGIMTVTVNGHGMETGDWIVMEEGAITFSCSNTEVANTQISHPRATDPYFNTPCEIISTTTNTFTLDVGDAKGYTGVHSFVRADGVFRPSVNPEAANEVVRLFKTISDIIEEDNYKETFGTTGYEDTAGYVAGGPGYGTDGKDTGLTNPEFKEPPLTGTGYDAAVLSQYEELWGSTPKYQYEIIDHIRQEYNGLAYQIDKCPRDVGYIVDAIAEDLSYGGEEATINAARYYFEGAVNILPYEQREPTRLAFEHLATVIDDIVTETAVTPTTGNTKTQDTSGTAATVATGTEAKRLANIISAVVDDRLVIPDYTGSLDISEGQQTLRPLPIANTATAPLIEPSRTFARHSLQKNKDFIQDEVVAYINDEYFVYDEDKCARDVGYIVNAVKRDVQTGGNYNGVYAGRAYRAGNASTDKVIEEQLAETIEAIKYLRRDIEPRLSGTALTTATASFDNIIAIMKGETAPAYNYGTAYQNTSAQNVEDGLDLNRDFIVEECIAWIATNYSSLSYDTAKCRRDVGYMLDAVKHDILHGSNVAMRDVARLYFENGVNVGLPADQRAPTAAVFEHLGTVSQQVVLKQTVSKSLSNPEVQVTAGFSTASAAEANRIPGLWNIVANIITEDSVINMPAAIEPQAGTGTGYNYEAEAVIIAGRLAPLAAGVNTHLQEKFDYLEYDSAKCRRDVGYMVDAISHDIQYGGNSAMWNAAQIYFVNAVNLLPLEQREPTKKAFMHMGKVMHDITRNTTVPLRIGRKYTPSTATYDVLNGQFVITLGNHDLKVGSHILLAKESFTFECGSPAVQISHPRVTDPAFETPLKVEAVTATTVTVNVGTAQGYTGAHTFVSATEWAVQTVVGNTKKQDKTSLAARREIAAEVKALGEMIAHIADDNNPTNLPARVEPYTNWIPATFHTEKDKVDDKLEALVTSMVNFISSEYNGISYPKEKCRRDVGIMIDAISHDVQYETNYATRLAANMYFDNATSVLPFDQRQQTADFYDEMANLVSKVIQELEAGQDTTNDAASSVEGEWAADMVRIVEEAIRRDGLDALPELVEPNTSWVDASKVWAGNAIDDNLGFLADDVVQHIKDNFTIIDYSKAKCRRDSGYIIDAISWDLNYGGNAASRWNADFYYWNNQLRIPENTRVATAQSYRRLGEIIRDVVTGSYPGQKLRPEMGDEERAKQAYDNGMIFYNALYFNSPKYLGPLNEPDFTWEDDKNKVFRFSKDILANNKRRLQREVQRFITSEYKFIDLPKTYRDANNLLKVMQNDFRYVDPSVNLTGEYNVEGAGGDQSTRAYAAAFFNIDAQHVFPVFNPPRTFADYRRLRFKGTVIDTATRDAIETKKRWDAYIIPTNNNGNRYIGQIWYWTGTTWANAGANNTDLLESFEGAWTQMKTYINNNIAPDLEHRNMVTELIDNVLIDTVLRPNFLTFGSLVESIAHQFNGASAGVNRNALPLNFRNVGSAISATASVLSENGGRIRWSGADELNNQYFARGLRINGRTGRIEGRPFTSSVRKLARRASNSRATI